MNHSPIKLSLIILAIALILLLLFLFSCGSPVPPEETETVSVSETNLTSDTHAADSDSDENEAEESDTDYEVVKTKKGDIYHIYKNHAVLVLIGESRDRISVGNVNGIPVSKIHKDALNSIKDKANFRIFSDRENIFARDFAKNNGCIFIEWYDGKSPDHYYPYDDDESVWIKSSPQNDIYYSTDNTQLINTAIAHYKSSNVGKETLTEALLQNVAAAASFSEKLSNTLKPYYTRIRTSPVVDDYDKYSVYMKGDTETEYRMIRFGELDEYEEIMSNLDTLYTEKAKSKFKNQLMEAGGYTFQKDRSDTEEKKNYIGEYELIIEENKISLVKSYKEDDALSSIERVFVYEENKWRLDTPVSFIGFEISDYEAFSKRLDNGSFKFEYDVITSKSGDVYHVYDDHAELIKIGSSRTQLLIGEINDIPITSISFLALDNITDKANFRIIGDGDSFARDYAIEHGCIFIELFDGSFPNHYYPYNGDESVWVENYEDANNFYYAKDTDERISELVSEYLSKGTGEREIKELMLYKIACAADFSITINDTLPTYYVREYTSKNVDDYDKYYIYIQNEKWPDKYPMVRYGKLGTYEDIMLNLELLYTPEVIYNHIKTYSGEEDRLINAGGYAFQSPNGIGNDSRFTEAEYELTITEDKITVSCSHRHFSHSVDLGYQENTTEFALINDRWLLTDIYTFEGYEASDYEALVAGKGDI